MTLSPAQRGLWVLDQLAPGNAFYNVPLAYRIRGELSVDALAAALALVVERHQVMRTSIVSEGGAPAALLRPVSAFTPRFEDLSSLVEGRREAEAYRRAAGEAGAAFDLATDLPFRSLLLRLSGTDHLLVTVFHHVAADETSASLALREVAAAYADASTGRIPGLPPVRLQYAEVARRQTEALRGEDLDVLLAFWRKKLRDAPRDLALPYDRPAPPVPSFKGATAAVVLPADVASRVHDLAGVHGCDAEVVLLAAFAALLRRYTAEDDVVVGWSVDGRTEPARHVVGTFLDVLPLRLDLSGDPAFGALVERVRDDVAELAEHRELPLEKLIEELRPRRTSGHAPLFQVAIAAGVASPEPFVLAGLDVEPVGLEASTARFDLFLNVTRERDGFTCSLELATDVFDPATVRALGRHWLNLLRSGLTSPRERLSGLALMDDAERAALVAPAAGRDRAGGVPLVHESISRGAAAHPDAVAVVAGETTTSYRELDEVSAGIAAALRARGVAGGSVVAVLADRGPRMVPAMLGILKAGCAYLPLDPAYPPARLGYMLEDSGAAAIVAASPPEGLAIPDGVAIVDPSVDAAGAPCPATVDERDAAYVIYTSGSTGQPKGVVVEHGSLARFSAAIAEEIGLSPADRVLQFASPSFDTAVEEIWPTLACGGTLVLRGPHPWDPAELREKVGAHDITVLDLPTAYWHELASACGDGIDVRECPSLRLVIVGGEAMSSDKTRLWHSTAPHDVRLLNTYGPTEATVTATSYDVTGPPPDSAPVAIGAPLAGTRAYVLDEGLEPVPPGVTGELFVGGTGVARGYLGRPGLTAERFLPDPYAGRPGRRMYRTGDRARLRRDGVLEFAGRRDHQLKIRGYRVEPGEIEAVLRSHPGVEEAVVAAGGGDATRLAAYLTGAAGDRDDLREWLRERLPEHMVPSLIVPLDAFPLTPGGKVDRAALAALAPGDAGRSVDAPRTPAEQVLKAIWQRLLGIEDVGLDDSFFDLGGHSLLATQLVSRVRHDFGVSLPLRTVFEWPTVAGLAGVVERSAAGAGAPGELPLERVARDRDLPLSFAQQRLWFIDQFKPGSADYVIAARSELRGPLDAAALRRAVTAVAERHEALRTTFPSHGGEARQEIAAHADVPFEVVDLTSLAADGRDDAAAAVLQRVAAQPFDLATGPLWRCTLIRLADDHHFFATCMHHIVSDGWSLGIFATELSELYSAAIEGREPRLGELDVSYADFAVWQRRWFQGDELERQLAYWKTQLEGAPAVLELPADRPRPPVQSFDGATVSFTLDQDLAGAISRLARAHEVTTFMVTLAAFKTLLHRYTGATDVVVGSPIAGRNRSEIEGLIGFFVNTLVLRTDLSRDPTFAELLERTREVALGAYAHQDLPFEKLVEDLGIERDLAHSPAVQVMFVLQNTPPADVDMTGVEASRLDAPTNEVSVDLTLDLTETAGGIDAKLVYNADLFDEATAIRLLGHFANVLRSVTSNPQVPLSRIELLDPAERRALVNDLNPRPTPYPSHLRVHEAFERVAEEHPRAPAVVYDEESLTYGELNARANRLARHLASHGVGRGDLVAVALERGPELIVALLAALKAGAAYLPLDPEHPRRRTRFMIEDAEARVLVTSDALAETLDLGVVRTISVERDAGTIASLEDGDLGLPGEPDDVAYAIYTSGSTGTPKGICIPHRAITRLVLETDYVKLGPGSIVLQVSNASFDAATFEIWGALLNGGRLAGIPKEVLLDARRLRSALERRPGAVAFFTTALFNQLVAEDPALFARMETVLVGGETADPATLRRCLQAGPPKDLVNVYGPTESTTFATWHRFEDVPEGAATVPIGRPIANTKVHILDPVLNPVPVGVPGEIYIGGPGLAVGYLNRPELTKERFVADPLADDPHALLYRTGDLARYLPSGDIDFLGRIDSQVKIRGFRVELGEIEATLAEHDAVSEAVVSVYEAGENDVSKRIVAYVSATGEKVPVPEVRRFLSERIPFYMVPSDFVVLDALPLNANGKIDRRALPAPDLSRSLDERDHVAPRNETERKLAAIWEALLGRSPGVHDGFFELGGHSLLATQLVSRVRDAFSVELELRAVFEAPTIARLAPRVEAAAPAAADAPRLRALPRR